MSKQVSNATITAQRVDKWVVRTALGFPEELDKQIVNLRKRDEYVRCSYSELVRILLESALKSDKFRDDTKPA